MILQAIMVVFTLICIATSISAIVVVLRSSKFKRKFLWIVGSLFGFAGLAISWTSPDDIYLQFGVSIPVAQIFKVLPNGPVILKALFPFVAAYALFKAYD